MLRIIPTREQLQALAGPKNIDSVKAADFLGKQDYIDEWICSWFTRNEWLSDELPLCVSESIICDRKLKREYEKVVRAAVVRSDTEWLRFHYIVPANVWSVVNFMSVSDELFDVLWCVSPVPLNLCAFVVQSRRMYIWKRFVESHGASAPLRDAVQQFWSEGTAYCLSEGADVDSEDYVRLCVRHERVFRQISVCNPPATQEAWEEFLLQRLLNRVENVNLVEEWFWIHGYRL